MLELGVQLLLCILMVPTIIWSILVHQRLRRLRTDQGEMTAFIEALNETIVRAETAISAMQAIGSDAIAQHDKQQREARESAENISRGIRTTARLLRRLETSLQQGTLLLAEKRTVDERTAYSTSGSDALNQGMTAPGSKGHPSMEPDPLDVSGEPQTAKGRELLRALASLR